MHLYTAFELLYSACHSVPCVHVIESFTYLLRVIISDVTKRRGVRAREKARGESTSSRRHHQRRKTKQDYVAVACLQLSSRS